MERTKVGRMKGWTESRRVGWREGRKTGWEGWWNDEKNGGKEGGRVGRKLGRMQGGTKSGRVGGMHGGTVRVRDLILLKTRFYSAAKEPSTSREPMSLLPDLDNAVFIPWSIRLDGQSFQFACNEVVLTYNSI